MKSKLLASLFFLLLFTSLFPATTLAHLGARDELGGHFRRDDCVYLLHSPTPLAKSAKNINELIALIKQNNSNSQCVSNLSSNTIDLEGYTFPNTPAVPAPSAPAPSAPPAAKQADTPIALGRKYSATLEKCVDGDTANFNINGKMYKTRFLYIDTPEYTTEKEPYGKEASEYTCSLLKQGKITLETDGSDVFDKYGRLLAWVWVGDKLQQEEITKAGLVEDFYDYGSYKYEQTIVTAMEDAKKNKAGMYADTNPEPAAKQETTEKKATSKQETTEKKTTSEKKQKAADQKQETKKEEKPIASGTIDPVKEEKTVSNGYAITGFLLAFLLFLLPRIKHAFGVGPIIAHKLKTRKWWINIILFFVYAAFWWIILLIIIIELLHLFKKKS